MHNKIIFLNDEDLDESLLNNVLNNGSSIAVDTETSGLVIGRDRLCLIQIALSNRSCYLLKINRHSTTTYPVLSQLLKDENILKIFHFGRFDIARLQHYLKIEIKNVFCTKIASKLTRTYTDKHGLPTLCKELLGKELSKEQQSSDWASDEITEAQKHYAASDVLHLHEIYQILRDRLMREYRLKIAEKCFEFLPHRATLDTLGWPEDIFDWK